MATTNPSPHDIVVLGASYAGLGTAHVILKAIPALQSQTKKTYRVILLANSTHFWWSVGAPRAALVPYPKSNDESFIPVAKGLEQYPAERYEFIHAEITGLDPETRQVSYKTKNEKEEISKSTSSIHFDTLVIATGSSGVSPLYALQGSHLPTLNAYKDIQKRLPSAQSVIVVGGGSVGTETAGELGNLHGKNSSSPKDITLLSGGDRLLPGLRPAIGARAQEMLEAMGVKVQHNLRLTDSRKLPSGGKEEVTLSDGSKRTVDILFVGTGRVPVTSYLPASLLNDKKKVTVDDYMRLPSIESAYAVGDLASNGSNGLVDISTSAPTTGANVVAELSGKGKGKEWKPMTTKDMQVVPVGPNGGVGAVFGWSLPSFAVRFIKAKTFMFEKAEKTVMGTA